MAESSDEREEGGRLGGLVCVEYPGVVRSPDNMINTLGGLDTIAQVLEEPNRRLELRFRPEDVFNKPTCGEKHADTSLLIRVKKKKLKPGRKPTEERPAEKCEVKVEGLVTDCYKFNNLCDFQYLPMVYSPSENTHTDIYDQVYPGNAKLVPTTWLAQESPLFVPPAAFSRWVRSDSE